MDLRKGFVEEIKGIIEDSRVKAIRAVDHVRVKMYWELGRKIVEEEQQGKFRAKYKDFVIRKLSEVLQPQFGSGFNIRQLERCRQLYHYFPIAAAVRPQLTWTHYRLLLRIDNQSKREFYEAETDKNTWKQLYLTTEQQLLEVVRGIEKA